MRARNPHSIAGAGTVLTAALLALVSWRMAPAQAATPAPCMSTVSGDLRLHRLVSRVFGNQRMIRVLLPPGYDAPENATRRYPVLYLLDGQALFDACLSDVSHREWGVDETVDRLVEAKSIPPLIVVGVDNGGAERMREYLPFKDFEQDPHMAEPVGRRFPDFLANEVIPSVNERYRTLRGPAHTGIGGSSYGGVAAFYALLEKPAVFGFGLVESAPLWVGHEQLVRDTKPLRVRPRKLYFGVGGREASSPATNARMLGLIRAVEANFRAADYGESRFRVVLDPEAAHNEDAWAKRLPGALEFLASDGQERAPAPR